MEKEIYTFDEIEDFKNITFDVEEKYPITVQLTSVKGNRWSHIAGNALQRNSLSGHNRIKIGKNRGIVIYGWNELQEKEKKHIVDIYKEGLACDEFSIVSTASDILEVLNSNDEKDLFSRADRIRRRYLSDSVHIRGIIEFSNYCKKDCLYCGLRKSNKKIRRYHFTIEKIYSLAKEADKFNYKTLVLQSGEDDYYNVDQLCRLIEKIKKNTDCAVTLSIGEKSYKEYKRLKEAGTDRYLLKFETSNRKLFKKLKPDSNYEERLQCIEYLRDLGYQVGSGNIVGLPNQTNEILAKDILLIKKLDLDMIGLGPFIPHDDTPLKGQRAGTLQASLKALALIRVMNKLAHIPATTALGTIHARGRQKGLQCGANVIMPNITAEKYRKHYQIYPDKVCVGENLSKRRNYIEKMIISLGRTVSSNYGHTLKKKI
jgi:biotin synthase